MSLLRKDQPLTVLALDPGEKVGWARALVAPDGEWSELRHGITELRDMAVKLGESFTDYDAVVYETFRLFGGVTLQSQIGSDLKTAQFVGIVRYLSWIHPTTALVSQGPDVKKTADKTSPEWLSEITHRPVKHDDGHDQDALRHLWFFTWKNYPIHKAKESHAQQT